MGFFSDNWLKTYMMYSLFVLTILFFRLVFDVVLNKTLYKKYPSVLCLSKLSMALLFASEVFVWIFVVLHSLFRESNVELVYALQFLCIIAYVLCAVSYALFAACILVRFCFIKRLSSVDMGIRKWFKLLFNNIKNISKKYVCLLWSFSVCLMHFMVCVFGVSESFFGNMHEWHFGFSDVLVPMCISFVIPVLLILLGVFVFSRFKWFSVFSLLLSVVVVMTYFQNLFFGRSDFINGSASFDGDMSLNQFIHTFVIAVSIIVVVFCYNKYKDFVVKIVIGGMAGIMLMLMIPFVSVCINIVNNGDEYLSENTDKYVLSGDGQFDISDDKNVIVFVMDSFSQKFIDYCDDDASFFASSSNLRDFVNYSDVGSNFCATCLAMPSILTGQDADMSIPTLSRNANMWNSISATSFYNIMHDNNFLVNLFTDSAEYSGGAENMLGKIDNIDKVTLEYDVDALSVYLSMCRLSMYKYLSPLFKGYCYVSGSDVINEHCHEIHGYDYNGGDFDRVNKTSIVYSNKDFNDNLVTNGLQIRQGVNRMNIIHLNGMHEPFVNIDGNLDSYKRVFHDILGIVDRYCDELKRNGVYDDALIIVTADHGDDFSHSQWFGNDMSASRSAFLIKLPHMTDQLFKNNDSPGYLPTDFLPTILDGMGYDYDDSVFDGVSLLRLNESDLRVRRHFALVRDLSYPRVSKCVGGSEAVYNAYGTITYNSLDDLINATQDMMSYIPLVDSWW